MAGARGLPAPTGFWGFVWGLLAAPATPPVLLAALGVAALVGLDAPPGAHPVTTVFVALPAALLPFAVAAGAVGRPRAVAVPRALWALGAGLAVLGVGVAGGGAGEARVRPGLPVEHYERLVGGRPTPYHLGGQLVADVQGDEVRLRLGVGEHEVGRATLPLDGAREARLGAFAVSVRAIEPGGEPSRLRFRARPRAGGAPVEGSIAAGRTVELAPGVRLTALRLSADFGGALGAAAQLQIDWPEGQASAWYFVDSPDLDARVGAAPWIVEPVEVRADPALVLDVRRPGTPWVASAGWALMAVALVGVALGRGREGAGA